MSKNRRACQKSGKPHPAGCDSLGYPMAKDTELPARTLAAPRLKKAPKRKSGSTVRRTRAPDQTREAILRAAVGEFAREGYGGARVDRISKAAKSNDRMLYYYFKSKEKLFHQVI